MLDPETLTYDAAGLLPAIVQTPDGDVRMLGWMNREAVAATLATGFVTFWSRSRQRLWTKGEQSGNRLRLLELRQDCDADTLLALAEPEGPTCHRGTPSCFDGEPLALPWLATLQDLLRRRQEGADLAGSYTQQLFARGVDRIGKKVVEESGEVVIAAKNLEREDSERHRDEFLNEAADLLFHLQVLLVSRGCGLEDAARVLQARHRQRT